MWLAGLGYRVEHRDLVPLHVSCWAPRMDGELLSRSRLRGKANTAIRLQYGCNAVRNATKRPCRKEKLP
jgi:hypothetical protein